MKENKQIFLNKLVKALQESSLFGDKDNNRLMELRYIRDDEDNEFVRPIFENGSGEDGYYDINVNYDSCIGMYGDIWKQFISRF